MLILSYPLSLHPATLQSKSRMSCNSSLTVMYCLMACSHPAKGPSIHAINSPVALQGNATQSYGRRWLALVISIIMVMPAKCCIDKLLHMPNAKHMFNSCFSVQTLPTQITMQLP